jgi:hypothetical protein
MSDTKRRQLYIKGYQLDDEKIRNFVRRQPDDIEPDWPMNWHEAIIDHIPRDAFLEFGVGLKPNGDPVTVLVLDKGYDRESLEREPVETEDEALARLADFVLTPGVWPSLWY